MYISIEDFFRNSESSGYQISPSGAHISYLAPYEGRMNLFVRPAEGGEAVRITSETDRSVAGYMWADDSRLLFMKDTGGDENFRLYGVNLDGSDSRCYTDFPDVRVGILDDLEETPDEILISMNRRHAEVFDPYRLNLQTGELTLLAENPGNIQGWMTDHDGRLRVATAIVDGINTQLLYRDTEDEDFRPVLTTNFKETLNFLEFTPDNRKVYAATNIGRDKMALVLVDPATCQEETLLFEHDTYDVSGITYSRCRKKLLSVFCMGHSEPVRHYFDEEEKAFKERLRALFPGKRCAIADMSKDETKYILYVGSDRTRGTYYFYDDTTDVVSHIADTAPWLPEEEMVAMHPVVYTSRDGLRIEAYLSLPKGYALDETNRLVRTDGTPAHPLPVVLHPHGGPWARDRWGFDSSVQFLCNRGYAVFQMNFRGSTGYGRKFLEASYKQWGLKMQDDITDGAEWLKMQGIADANRLAIYGGSYGGYAALAGVTFTPDLYACAIDYVGVSNLFTFMETIPPYWKPMLEMLYEEVGHPQHDYEQLAATSPALHADKIKAPLFIAQGANDPRVNKAESDQMVEALRERGVAVEYMVKDDEGHGFANEENRFDFFRAMEKFLAKYL